MTNAEGDTLIEKAEEQGVQPIVPCNVLGIGRNPEETYTPSQ